MSSASTLSCASPCTTAASGLCSFVASVSTAKACGSVTVAMVVLLPPRFRLLRSHAMIVLDPSGFCWHLDVPSAILKELLSLRVLIRYWSLQMHAARAFILLCGFVG